MVFQVGNRILCGNVGDSRAIMVKGDKAIPLSIDQKPDDPEESKRIKEMEEKFHNMKKMGKKVDLLEFGKKEKFILELL